MNWESYFKGEELKELDGNYIIYRKPKRKINIYRVIKVAIVLILTILIILTAPVKEIHTKINRVKDVSRNKNAYLVQIIKEDIKPSKKVVKTLNKGGYTEYIKQKSNEVGIDYKIVVAISRLETGNFTSSVFREKNNPGGIKTWINGKRYNRTFSNKKEGFDYMINLLKANYIDLGLNTLEKIQPKYAPTSDDNSNWLKITKEIYNEI